MSRVILFVLVFWSVSAFAQSDTAIFEVRQNLSMGDGEKVYKDYYINSGVEKGLRSGMVVTVRRRINLYDPFQNGSPGDLLVDVGRLKIIHVQQGLSVARLYDLFDRADRPNLDYNFMMIGDRIDLKSMTLDAKSARKPNSESSFGVRDKKVDMIGPPKPDSNHIFRPAQRKEAAVSTNPIL